MSHARRLVLLALVCAGLCAPLPALAGSLSVSPIRIEMAAGQRSVTLTVRNDGDEPTLVQTQLVSWAQADNDERLEPTSDLLASPPIFNVAKGASQVVRIALLRPADAERERAYRILVSEVPGKPQADFKGAQFALKISLPIFVDAAAAKAAPQIEWRAVRTTKGELTLTAFNSGASHLQVRSVTLGKTATDVDARFAGLWYVLPGQRHSVTIAADAGHTIAADRLHLRADTDAGVLAADVVLQPH